MSAEQPNCTPQDLIWTIAVRLLIDFARLDLSVDDHRRSPPSFGLHLIFSNKRDKTTKLFPAPHCCRAPGLDLYIILENIHGSIWQVGISLVSILVFCLIYPQLSHANNSFIESLSAGYGACWASLSHSKYHHCRRHHGH